MKKMNEYIDFIINAFDVAIKRVFQFVINLNFAKTLIN